MEIVIKYVGKSKDRNTYYTENTESPKRSSGVHRTAVVAAEGKFADETGRQAENAFNTLLGKGNMWKRTDRHEWHAKEARQAMG